MKKVEHGNKEYENVDNTKEGRILFDQEFHMKRKDFSNFRFLTNISIPWWVNAASSALHANFPAPGHGRKHCREY